MITKIRNNVKTVLLFFFIFFCNISSFCQSNLNRLSPSDTTQPVFGDCSKFTDREEQWHCTIRTLTQFIEKNIQIPNEVAQSGSVYISFMIIENGELSNITALKKLSPSCDSAALKVVQLLPKFSPATFENKPVTTQFILPIRFQKTDDTDLSNGFQLFWGNYRTPTLGKNDFQQLLQSSMIVRDLNGNTLNINELLFERNKKGVIEEVSTRGSITDEATKLIKKMRSGEKLTVIATVQQKGKFFYVEKQFTFE